jgi:hypothetical protein
VDARDHGRPRGGLFRTGRAHGGAAAVLALAVFFAAGRPCLAGTFKKSAGTTAAAFLKLGVGARYLAMGETGAATADDANALYWNPARLSRVTDSSLSLMYSAYLDSVKYQFAGYAQPVPRLGAVGLSFQSLLAGSIARTSDTGREQGNFAPRDFAGAVGWGKSIAGPVSAGVTAKLIESRIVHSATALAVDGGLGYDAGAFSAAAGFRNAGSRMRYRDDKEKLPFSARLGAAYKIRSSWLFALEGDVSNDANSTWQSGAEYRLLSSDETALFLRAGYQTRTRDVPGFEGFSAGWGWRWTFLDVDYAWVPTGLFDFGQTHRLSLTFRLGGGR